MSTGILRISLATLFFIIGIKGQLLPHCTLPLHHGVQNCTNSSSIRWHMDSATKTCLAFRYSGCGGNLNNFIEYGKCTRCFAADYSGCPAGSNVVRKLNSDSSTCGPRGLGKCDTPGSYCKRGAFFGMCCNQTIREMSESDYNMEKGCGAGQKKVELDTKMGFKSTLLGKTCGSNFCPSKSTCHQGNFYAYCCTSS